MKRGRSTGAPTKPQQARFDAIQQIGCLCCHAQGLGWSPAEVHHLTIGGRHGQKRRGHDYTVGLCATHHRGVWVPWIDKCRPLYSEQPRAFRERFGDDDALLAEQNRRIEEWRQSSVGAAA